MHSGVLSQAPSHYSRESSKQCPMRLIGEINRNFIDLIKLDQRSREEHTKALTRLHSSLDEFNHINGSKQAECDRIREEMTRQIDRLKEASK